MYQCHISAEDRERRKMISCWFKERPLKCSCVNLNIAVRAERGHENHGIYKLPDLVYLNAESQIKVALRKGMLLQMQSSCISSPCPRYTIWDRCNLALMF